MPSITDIAHDQLYEGSDLRFTKIEENAKISQQ